MWTTNFVLAGIVFSGAALYFPLFFVLVWPLFISVGGVLMKFIFEAVGVWLLYRAFRWLAGLKLTLSPAAVTGQARAICWVGHSALVVGHLIVLYAAYHIVFPEKIYIGPGDYSTSNDAPVPFFVFASLYLVGLIAVFVVSPSKRNAQRQVRMVADDMHTAREEKGD